jgi:hypothetical protein
MDRNDLTKEQAREICKVIEGYLRYLLRLRTRMEQRGFPATDRTYVNVCQACDAIQALPMDFHYLACGRVGSDLIGGAHAKPGKKNP